MQYPSVFMCNCVQSIYILWRNIKGLTSHKDGYDLTQCHLGMLKVIKRKKLMICVCIIPLLWRNIGCSCLSKDSVTLVKYFFYLFTENEKRCLQYSQSWTISSKIIRNNSEFLLFWTMIIKVYPRFFVKKTKQTEMLHS